jgi:hypothetical protein
MDPTTTTNESQALAHEYMRKLLERARREQALKDFNKELRVLETQLYDTMEREGLPEFVLEKVDGVVLSEPLKISPDVKREFKLVGYPEKQSWDLVPKWFAWLKERGEDGIIQSKPSVHWKRRVSFLKQFVDNKGDLPGFIEESFSNVISYNKEGLKRITKAALRSE